MKPKGSISVMLFIVEPVTRARWLKEIEHSEEWALPPAVQRPNPFLPGEIITVREHPGSTRRVLTRRGLEASAKLSEDEPDVLIVETADTAAVTYIAQLFGASYAQLK